MAVLTITNSQYVFQEGCYHVYGPGNLVYIDKDGVQRAQGYPYSYEDTTTDPNERSSNGGGYGSGLGDPTFGGGTAGMVTVDNEILYIKSIISSTLPRINKVDCPRGF